MFALFPPHLNWVGPQISGASCSRSKYPSLLAPLPEPPPPPPDGFAGPNGSIAIGAYPYPDDELPYELLLEELLEEDSELDGDGVEELDDGDDELGVEDGVDDGEYGEYGEYGDELGGEELELGLEELELGLELLGLRELLLDGGDGEGEDGDRDGREGTGCE